MADKGALELIGMLLFAATIFVVAAGGFVVRHQLAADMQPQNTVEVAQLPARAPAVAAAPYLVK